METLRSWKNAHFTVVPFQHATIPCNREAEGETERKIERGHRAGEESVMSASAISRSFVPRTLILLLLCSSGPLSTSFHGGKSE